MQDAGYKISLTENNEEMCIEIDRQLPPVNAHTYSGRIFKGFEFSNL